MSSRGGKKIDRNDLTLQFADHKFKFTQDNCWKAETKLQLNESRDSSRADIEEDLQEISEKAL